MTTTASQQTIRLVTNPQTYELHDANGNFEKHGVSQDASKRYSQKQLNGGQTRTSGTDGIFPDFFTHTESIQSP
jgi:hypothetical protein